MLFQHFDWDFLGTFSLHFAQPSYELERPTLGDARTLVQN